MTNLSKITKLIDKLRILSACIEKEKDSEVHQRIDTVYYRRKAEKLKTLYQQQLDTAKYLQQTSEMIDKEYTRIYTRWKKDIRWLNSPTRKEFKTIL